MDISTIIGLVTAVGFVIFAIGGNIGTFFDINSIAIVFGGTIGATFVRYPIKMIAGLLPVTMKTLFV